MKVMHTLGKEPQPVERDAFERVHALRDMRAEAMCKLSRMVAESQAESYDRMKEMMDRLDVHVDRMEQQ